MKGKFLSVTVIIVLLILAGCVGGSNVAPGDDSGDDAGDTDGDAPAGAVTLVENRTAELMAAGGYTSVWEMASETEGERVGAITYTHAVDYENERSSFEMRMVDEGEVSTDQEVFYADGTRYTRYGSGEEATYHVEAYEFAPQQTLFPVESSITSADDLEAFSSVGTETYDGATVTRYERTDRPTWVDARADAEFSWTSFNYVVLVDEDGLVRYESWGGDGVDDEGVEHTITFSFALTDVGETVIEDPDWLAMADQQAT